MNKNTSSNEESSLENQNTSQGSDFHIQTFIYSGLTEFSHEDGNIKKLIDVLKNPSSSNATIKELHQFLSSFRSRFEKNSSEANISDQDIQDALADSTRLRRSILDITTYRTNLEDTTFNFVKKLYPDELGSSSDKKKLKQILSEESDWSLRKILRSRTYTHEYVRGYFPGIRLTDDVTSFLKSLSLSSEATDLSDEMKDALATYVSIGYMDPAALENWIKVVDIDTKKKLLEYFVPQISVSDLKKYKVFTQEKIEIFQKEAFQKILIDQGIIQNQSEFNAFIRDNNLGDDIRFWAKNLEDVTIDTKNLSNTDFKSLLSTNIATLVAANMSDELKEISKTKNEPIKSLHDFLSILKLRTSGQGKECKIRNLQDFSDRKYLVGRDEKGEKKTWKINSAFYTHEDGTTGVELQGYTDNGKPIATRFVPYSNLLEYFTDLPFYLDVESEAPEYLVETASEYPFQDFAGFQDWADRIDTKGQKFKIANGVSYTVVIEGKRETYTFLDVDSTNGTFHLSDEFGHPITKKSGKMSMYEFYSICQKSGTYFDFTRIGDFTTQEKFAENSGIQNLVFHDQKLQIRETLHDEHHTEKFTPLWGFKGKNGAYIETRFSGDRVQVFLYENITINKKKSDDKTKASEKKVRKTQYEPDFTLEAFYLFLEDEELTSPLTSDPRAEKGEEHDDVHAHAHSRSLMSRFMDYRSIADYTKAFSMGTHMIEHMFEERSKAQASEAMYGFFKKTLGDEHALTNHALMDFSGEVGKLIDEKIAFYKKLFGEPRRKELKHILLTRPARQVDILAALIVTADMSGHLYPDSQLQDLQGSRYLWFESLCIALGYDYETELRKANEKEGEKNAETQDHLHEATLIERFFKGHQTDNPYIQAINGGSKFWGAIKSGRSAQKEKGQKESSEFLGAMDRAEYVISKFESNEPEIGIGAFPSVYGKDPSAKNLGPAFVYAMSNFPATAHPDMLNEFKNMMDANGVAFHALPFCRNSGMSAVYKDTVNLVVHHSHNPKMEADWHNVQSFAPHGKYTFNDKYIKALWVFWKNYNDQIHPILQLTDPTIFTLLGDEHTTASEKSILKSYLSELNTTVSQGKLQDSSLDPMIMKTGGYRFDGGSMVVDVDESNQRSIKRNLGYMRPTGHDALMDDNDYKLIWSGQIMPYLDSMKKNPNFVNNPDYQKKQFSKIHNEIIGFLRQRLSGVNRDRYINATNTQPYLKDLRARGFDVSYENVIAQQEFPGTKIDFGTERAFNNFMDGSSGGSQSAVEELRTHVEKDALLRLGYPVSSDPE